MKSIGLSIFLSLSLLLSAQALTPSLSPADYFHMGVTNYCRTNIAQARKDVTNGLALYPNNPWLTNLWELLNRKDQQQQQQQQQNQDKDKDQESKDQQSKDQQQQDQQKKDQEKQEQQKQEQQKQEEQKKKEEEQKAADQKKKDEQAKQGQQDGSDQQQQDGQEDKDGEPQAAKMIRMTPQQAMQLLDMLKSDEKNMPFKPILRTNRNQRVFKDW